MATEEKTHTVRMTEAEIRVAVRMIEMVMGEHPQDLRDAGIFEEAGRAWLKLQHTLIGNIDYARRLAEEERDEALPIEPATRGRSKLFKD